MTTVPASEGEVKDESSSTTITQAVIETEETPVVAAAPATTTTTTKAKPPPNRIVRRRRQAATARNNAAIPSLDEALLQKVMHESGLPTAYSFEIPKTVTRIVELQARHVALQLPEGLLMYATVLADVLQRLSQNLHQARCQQQQQQSQQSTITTTTTNVCQQVSVLGDVTYGACCIGDLDAQVLGANLLVHYGHSCLVPLQHTVVPCLYVFVEILIDVPHMIQSLNATLQQQLLPSQQQPHPNSSTVVYLLGTIQFRHALETAKELLIQQHGYEVYIPQVKPLSPGEVLGCTSPKLNLHRNDESSTVVCCFLADGRFHLESTMISNPHITTFYRYDPYGKTLTLESYAHDTMKSIRWNAIEQTQHQLTASSTTNNKTTTTFGILLGTLGRQGNPAIVQRIRQALFEYNQKNNHNQVRSFVMLLSEITPAKLAIMDSKVQIWIQVACPRLSVDWGHALATNQKPVLSPYEFFVALQKTEWQTEGYPMDYYALSGGPWANYHVDNKTREIDTGVVGV